MKKIVTLIALFAVLLILGVAFWKKSSLAGVKKTVSGKRTRITAKSNIPKELIRPEEEAQVYSEQLKVGDLDLPLLFDESVSEELKQFILKDFSLLYSSAEYKIYNWEKINKRHVRNLQLNNKEYYTSKRVAFTDASVSNILHEKLGDIITDNGIQKIIIPDEIIQAYEKASRFISQNSREYEELADFVYMMTTANEETPITLHPEEIFYMPGAPVFQMLKKQPELVSQAQKNYSETTRLRMPSVLEFTDAPPFFQKKGINLSATGYSLKDDTNIPSVKIGFVYHEGRWKILGSDGGA